MDKPDAANWSPLVSCVVVTHNCRDELVGCLKALTESAETVSVEILVVDNASSDGTAEIVEQGFPSVKLIYNRENMFLTRANNQGLAQARGKYVLVINPDVFVQKDTLPKMVEFMEAHPSAGAASCMFLNQQGKTIQACCWHFRTLAWVIMSREPQRRLFANSNVLQDVQMADWDRRTQREVDVVSGALTIARMSALQQVGFFDEDFLLYFSDDDLCMRLKRVGFSVFHTPVTAICHLVSRSTRKKPILSILKIQRDDLVRYFRKHHGAGAALVAWVVATIELITWRLYLLVKPEATDADKTKVR